MLLSVGTIMNIQINSLIYYSIKYVIFNLFSLSEADLKFTQMTSFSTYVFIAVYIQYPDKSKYTIICTML